MATFLVLSIASAQTSIDASATSQKTQSFVEAGGFIAYIDLTKPDERHTYEIDFSPPDGVSKLLSSEIIVKGDFPPSSLVTITLNGQPCNPREWTTPASEKRVLENYEVVFECVDSTKEMIGRKWTADFSTNAQASNVRLTYKNKYYNDWNLPEVLKNELGGTLAMHGTEYTVGDRAKLWLQAIDSSGKSVNNAVCYVDAYYPYGSPLIERATMTLLEDGIYYYDVIIPPVVGVYPVIGLCYYSIATQEETADAGYVLNGTSTKNSYTATVSKNDVYWEIEEALVSGKQRITIGLNYTSVPSLTGLTEVDFDFEGRWNGGTDVITIYFYNWTSATWQDLPNTIPDTGAIDLGVSNSIATSNATISGIRKDGNIYIQFRDSSGADATKSKLKIDYMAVNLLNLSGDKETEIKGSSEIHAKAKLLSSSDYLNVWTPCGEVDPTVPDGCGTLVNFGDIMNFLEKEIEVNITATSLASENDTLTSWVYQTPIAQDCTSIYYILHYNGTGWEDVMANASMYSNKGNENCHIIVQLETNPNQIDQYRIIMDNYMLWEIQWTQAMANVTNSTLSPLCTDYALQFNYTYTVPITEDTFVNRSDNQLFGCHRFFDDQHYINYYSDLANQAQTVAELTSYYIEVVWYQSSLRHNLQFATFNYAYNDFLIASAQSPSNIWNYPNRTLTDYNQTKMWQYLSEINTTGYNTMSLINNVNASLFNYIMQVNNSIYTRIDQLSTQVNNVNSSISNQVTSLKNDIYAINTSLDNHMIAINNSIMFKLYSIQNEISSVNQTILDTKALIGSVNTSISNRLDSVQNQLNSIYSVNVQTNDTVTYLKINLNTTLLEALIKSVNATLYDEIISTKSAVYQINQSIMDKMYLIQNDLLQIYTVAQTNNISIAELKGIVLLVNETTLNKLNTIENNITQTYNEVINTFNQLNLVNQSVMNKLYSIQGDLSEIITLNQDINATVHNITVDITPILGFLAIMNSTMVTGFSNMESQNNAINQSIMNKLYSMQTDLADIYALSLQINGSTTNILYKLDSINQSLYNRFDEVLSLTNAVNSSIFGKLYLVQGDLQNLYNLNIQINDTVANINFTLNTTKLEELISAVNETLNARFDSVEALSLAMNQSIMVKLYSLQTELSQVNQSIYDRFGVTDNLILSVNDTLFNQIIDLKTDITSTYNLVMDVFTQLNLTNATIMNKLYGLQTELANVNSSIYDRFGQTDNLILSVNSSLYGGIVDLKNDVLNTYNQVINVYSQLNDTNQTIMNKLYLLQDDLANIYSINQEINETVHNISINLTPVIDFLYLLNQSVESGFLNTQNSVYAINQSIMNKLFLMQDDLANIYTINQQINETVNSLNVSVDLTPITDFLSLMNITMVTNFGDLINLGYAVNQSIMNKLYLIQGDLSDIYTTTLQINGTTNQLYGDLLSINQSVTNAIYEVNSSVFSKLYSIQGDLAGITADLYNLSVLVNGVNTSVSGDIQNIQTGVTNLGVQINAVNYTVMTKLYLMQDEISSVNQTTLATNYSVMNKLYMIQDDLENLLNNLTNQLANVSNLTFNITTDLKTVATDVWELFFIRGTPPLAPSTDYYCKADDPNILVKNITYDYRGQAFGGYFTKAEDMHCSYGCVNGTIFSTQAYCDYDPTTKIGVAIAVIVALIVITWFVLRSKEEGGVSYE